jgi:hypothetical protein
MKSDLVEEETVVQNSGSSLWAGFLVWGLLRSLIGFWVSSSSSGLCCAFLLVCFDLHICCSSAVFVWVARKP